MTAHLSCVKAFQEVSALETAVLDEKMRTCIHYFGMDKSGLVCNTNYDDETDYEYKDPVPELCTSFFD